MQEVRGRNGVEKDHSVSDEVLPGMLPLPKMQIRNRNRSVDLAIIFSFSNSVSIPGRLGAAHENYDDPR